MSLLLLGFLNWSFDLIKDKKGLHFQQQGTVEHDWEQSFRPDGHLHTLGVITCLLRMRFWMAGHLLSLNVLVENTARSVGWLLLTMLDNLGKERKHAQDFKFPD